MTGAATGTATGAFVETYEELYEQAPCGYLSTSLDGVLLRANATLLAWVGLSRAEVVGRTTMSQLLSPGARIYYETHVRPLLHMQGAVREIAVEVRRADGSRLPALLNGTVVPDAEGRPAALRFTLFDARDRRRYEAELLAARRAAEAAHQRAAFLASLGRALDEVPGLAARAQRLADVLVAGPAERARVELVGLPPLEAPQQGPEDPATVPGRRRRVPLQHGTQVLGVLEVDVSPQPLVGVPDELPDDLLEEAATRAAVALDNARLYEQQQDAARTLQRSLLPGEPPHDARFASAAHYRPAREDLDVGGDWYDVFPTGPDHVALVVGDVVGRGLEAATAMGQLRSAVRALATTSLSPGELLERLDRFVAEVPSARMATVVLAELSLSDGQVRYACAGHPPPLLLPLDGPAATLEEGRSAPLGAHLEPVSRPEGRAQVEPGGRLLLYTDGLVERRDRDVDESILRLRDRLTGHRDRPLERLVELVAASMLVDEQTRDDACLLCVGYRDGTALRMSVPARPRELSGTRRRLEEWLTARAVPEDARQRLVLACSEAVANAIEHGYQGDPARRVSVVALLDGADVVVQVKDWGVWRAPLTRDPMRRGRGLRIIEAVVDEVRTESGDGTTVTMAVRRTVRAGEAP